MGDITVGQNRRLPKYQNNINCIVLYIFIDNAGYEGRDGKGWYGRDGRDGLNRKGGIGRKGWEEGMGR